MKFKPQKCLKGEIAYLIVHTTIQYLMDYDQKVPQALLALLLLHKKNLIQAYPKSNPTFWLDQLPCIEYM